jgi:competence ComEA-like helix-hairpin-helix protein
MGISPGGLWSTSQRHGLVLILAGILIILGIRLILNPARIDVPTHPQFQLADRLDPNTASAPELAAIPGLGEKRAEAIVEYRQHYRADHPTGQPFKELRDLERITGIGVAMTENMEPYLLFPTPPATQN